MDFFWIKYRRQLSTLNQLTKRPDSAQQLAEKCIFDAQFHYFTTLQLVLKHKKLYKQFTNNSVTSIRCICKIITSTPMPYALDTLLHSEIARHILEYPNIAPYLCNIICTHASIANALFTADCISPIDDSSEPNRLLQKMRKALLYDKNAAQYLCNIMTTYKKIAITLFQRAYQSETDTAFQRAYRVEINPIQLIFKHHKKNEYLAVIKKSYNLDHYIQRAYDGTDLLLNGLNARETCRLFLHALLASHIDGTPQLGISPTISSHEPWAWYPSASVRPISFMPTAQQIR